MTIGNYHVYVDENGDLVEYEDDMTEEDYEAVIEDIKSRMWGRTMVRVQTIHNVGELIEALQLFDKETPVCLYDGDRELANTLTVNHKEDVCSYDSNYEFIKADSLVLKPQLD